jgi:hypothetical protein
MQTAMIDEVKTQKYPLSPGQTPVTLSRRRKSVYAHKKAIREMP